MSERPDSRSAAEIMACHACDLLCRVPTLGEPGSARCARCGSLLYRETRNALGRALHCSVAALVLFVVANVYPFMTFRLEGLEQRSTIATGVMELWRGGLPFVASLVFLTTILLPAVKISGLLWVLVPLRLGRSPRHLGPVFRVVNWIGPWAMLEVYMLGVLVAFVKLSDMATLVLGVAFWSFCGLIVMTTTVGANLDPRIVWRRIGVRA